MEAKANTRNTRISARKARLVTRLIQGRSVAEALHTLRLVQKKSAPLIEKVLRSAVANALQKEEGVREEQLKVVRAVVDEGPRMKRFRPAPRGRALRIIKRTSHIRITVGDGA
jgi:large subunit ribosomal protein L22